MISIQDEDILHRRIHETFSKSDGSISSQAFKDPEMSVDVAKLTTTEATLKDHSSCGLVALETKGARDLNQEVIHEPLTINGAHALVKGKKTKAIARKLAKLSSWVVNIPQSR